VLAVPELDTRAEARSAARSFAALALADELAALRASELVLETAGLATVRREVLLIQMPEVPLYALPVELRALKLTADSQPALLERQSSGVQRE